MWALIGDSHADPAQPPGVEWIEAGGDRAGREVAVMVTGGDRIRRQSAAVAALPRPIALVVPAPPDATDGAAIVREATLAGAGVVVEREALPDAVAHRWIERADHLPWVLSCPTALDVSRALRLPWQIVEASDAEPTDEAAALGPVAPASELRCAVATPGLGAVELRSGSVSPPSRRTTCAAIASASRS
jgi:hypothetical protein